MIGKTIKQVVDLDYHGQALIFTDGTAVELHPTGYEADGVAFEECYELDVFHELALQINYQRDAAERGRRQRQRYEAGEMKGLELVVYESMRMDLEAMRGMMNRQVFGSSPGQARRS